MQDKSEKASPVNTKNGFVRNTLQTSTRKIYRNRKKPERKTQREGPKKTRFFRPDLPIRPITGFFRKNSGVEKSRNLPRPPLSEKRHRPTPSEHRNMIYNSICIISRILLVTMLLTAKIALLMLFCFIQRFARFVAEILLDPSGIQTFNSS